MASGPIGFNIAIEMRANGMVFHSVEHIVPLFIHSSPLVTAWCLHWHSEAFMRSYPAFEPIIIKMYEGPTPSLTEYMLPALCLYGAWWILYTTWLTCFGLNLPAKGYDTVYASICRDLDLGKIANKITLGLVPRTSTYRVLFIYMFVHAFHRLICDIWRLVS